MTLLRDTRDRVAPGYILLEAMVAIAILTGFSLVALHVAVASLRLPAQAAHRENGLITEASAVERLRADVWSATKIDINVGGRSIKLQSDSGTTTRWALSKRGSLIAGELVEDDQEVENPGDASMRIAQQKQSSTMTWQSFAALPAGVVLRGERTSGDFGAHEIVLPAPILIAEMKGHP